ncbi:hypothetical protein M885DRAFT_504759 [Pelagophyceae sp. CCMP2097]|nr:hypothetical protein M885DRAFT_504759 [Pelagophyceae sp. CCMP2097]
MADWDEARFLEVVVSCVDEGNQSQTHRAAQLFKTQMCPHSAEACRKGASCLFAHTANELRPLPERAHAGEARETTPEAPRPAGRAALVYRTKMCPSGADCLKGRNCKFAHSAADLRPLAHAAAARENDERPPPRTVAAAVNDRPARPDAATWAVMTMTERAVVLFKTQMCPYLASCHYGSRCSFAHSNDELRPPRGNEVRAATTAPPTTAPPTTAAAAPPTTTAAPPARDGGGVAAKDRVSAAAATTKPDRAVTTKPDRAALLYKTQMCPYADKSCHNGSGCKFAHSSTELRPPPARQPPGKEAPPPTTAPRDGAATQLEADCEALVHSHGAKLKNIGTAKMCPFKDGCHWGSDCGFAHSAAELRPPPGKEAHAAAPAPHSATSAASATTASSDGPAAAAALRTKTKICFAFAAGSCKMKGKCKFAHSEAELRPPSATAGEKTDDAAQAPAETPAHAPAAAPAQAPAAPAAPPASAAAPIGASGATGPASVFEDDWAEDGASTPADEADDRDEAEHRATADAASARQNVGLFKTVMCRMVGTKRGCPRGGGCMFAHSRNEIRVAADKAEADEAATPVVGDAAAATADAGDEAVVDEAVVDEAVVDEAVVDLVDEAVVDLGEYEEEGVENDASPVANAAAQTDDADDAVAPKKQGGDEGVDAPDDDSDEVVGGDAGDGDAGTTDGDEVVPPEACEAPLRLVSPAALRCDDDDVSSCGRSFDTTGSEGTVSSLSTGDAAMPRECLAQDGRGSPVSAGDYAEAKECRGRTVLEYSEIPSNAGWKATINARTIIIGTDPGRVRYRESEVVSTSGAKFVVHRPDVPQMKHKGSIRAAASRADSGQKSPTKAP